MASSLALATLQFQLTAQRYIPLRPLAGVAAMFSREGGPYASLTSRFRMYQNLWRRRNVATLARPLIAKLLCVSGAKTVNIVAPITGWLARNNAPGRADQAPN